MHTKWKELKNDLLAASPHTFNVSQCVWQPDCDSSVNTHGESWMSLSFVAMRVDESQTSRSNFLLFFFFYMLGRINTYVLSLYEIAAQHNKEKENKENWRRCQSDGPVSLFSFPFFVWAITWLTPFSFSDWAYSLIVCVWMNGPVKEKEILVWELCGSEALRLWQLLRRTYSPRQGTDTEEVVARAAGREGVSH